MRLATRTCPAPVCLCGTTRVTLAPSRTHTRARRRRGPRQVEGRGRRGPRQVEGRGGLGVPGGVPAGAVLALCCPSPSPSPGCFPPLYGNRHGGDAERQVGGGVGSSLFGRDGTFRILPPPGTSKARESTVETGPWPPRVPGAGRLVTGCIAAWAGGYWAFRGPLSAWKHFLGRHGTGPGAPALPPVTDLCRPLPPSAAAAAGCRHPEHNRTGGLGVVRRGAGVGRRGQAWAVGYRLPAALPDGLPPAAVPPGLLLAAARCRPSRSAAARCCCCPSRSAAARCCPLLTAADRC